MLPVMAHVEATTFFNSSVRGGRSRGRFGGRFAGRGGRNNRQTPICTYCGLIGYTVDKGYKKFGYPIGYKNPNANKAAVNSFGSNTAHTHENTISYASASSSYITPSLDLQTLDYNPFQQVWLLIIAIIKHLMLPYQ